MVVIKENEPLSIHTTFKAGGVSAFYVEINSIDDLKEISFFASQKNTPVHFIGGGSNTLFKDGKHNIFLIKCLLKGIEITDYQDYSLISVFSGEDWDSLVDFSVEKNLWGLENLSAIPGTVGGACVQNIGAYGVELKDVLVEVEAYDLENKNIKVFSNKDCKFNYRDSFFKTDEGKKFLITRATLKLTKDCTPKISYKDLKNHFSNKVPVSSKEVRDVVMHIRSSKFPDLNMFGTAGSFFKNPIVSKEKFINLQRKFPEIVFYDLGDDIKLSLAWILDNVCNLKGFRDGNVMLWKNQPLVVATQNEISAEKIILFTKKIKKIIKEKIDVDIENEVIIF